MKQLALLIAVFSLAACSSGFKGVAGSTSQQSTVNPTPNPAPSPTPSPSPSPAPSPSPSPSPGTGQKAIPANDFLSSTGVNTHIDQGYDSNAYIAPLKFLGIRNIRDGERNITNAINVHNQTGVMVDLQSYCDIPGMVQAGKQLQAAGALMALEGTNEPNNFTIDYNGQTGGGSGSWLPVAQCQRDLYSTIKADSILKNFPVFTVSEEGAEQQNVGLQWLTIPAGSNLSMADGTVYADYANAHNYVCSNQNIYQDNMAWDAADNGNSNNWPGDGLYGEFGKTWAKGYNGYSIAQLATLPKVTTETGWDSVSGVGGERVQGIVLVNTYLSQFKRGWRYTFIYELVDGEGSQGNQGLYTSSYQPKLVANYIHNLTTILADKTSTSNPGSLNYSIANEPTTVHDMLLQKNDGTFELVVWGESAKNTNNVTVNLGGSHATVNVYDVTSGTTPTQTLNNVSSVTLSMSDHAMIIEIKN